MNVMPSHFAPSSESAGVSRVLGTAMLPRGAAKAIAKMTAENKKVMALTKKALMVPATLIKPTPTIGPIKSAAFSSPPRQELTVSNDVLDSFAMLGTNVCLAETPVGSNKAPKKTDRKIKDGETSSK